MKSSTSLPFKNFFINAYLLPGFLFILTIILVCFVFRSELYSWAIFKSDFFNELSEISNLKQIATTDISLFIEFLTFAVLIFMSLIIGNGISVLGGLLFDTLWMGRGIGWPYERILGLEPKNYLRKAFNIFVFTYLNVITLLYILGITNGFWFSLLSIYILVFYLFFKDLWIKEVLVKQYGNDNEIKKFVSNISANNPEKMFEHNFVLYEIHKSKSENKSRFRFFINYIIKGLFIDLSVTLAIVFGKFFNLTLGIDKSSREKFIEKFKKTFNVTEFSNNTNIYWFIYIHLSKVNPDCVRTANSHLKRSILLRNLSASGLLILYLFFLLKPEFQTEINANNDLYYRWKVWAFVWYLSTYLLFIGYNHIYHKYYTKYLIRCFILENKETSTMHNNVYN